MHHVAIKVNGVGKSFRISARLEKYRTLRDSVSQAVAAPYRALRARWSDCAPSRRNAGSQEIFQALQDVSFEIRQGEVVGIVGRNGAGKSTLLKILSRITEPDQGPVEYFGRIGSRLEVGTGGQMELSGRENVYLNGAILGMTKSEIERKFDEIVDFAEVDRFIDTPVKHYSSGMYMRLAFAVAAHLDPDILLVDEVLSVGDLAFQRKCLEHAKRLQEGNATVLFVSHNMFAVKALCNRVIYIADGQVHFDGSPEDAIQLYERESRLSIASWAQHMVGTDPSQRPIIITDIALLDEGGEPRRVFDYGERMRIRLQFEASEQVANPNFNVSVFRSDNVPCCNYNTSMDGLMIPEVSGKGVIDVLTPPLKLVSELYAMHVMVWDTKFERLYSAQVGTTFHVRHHLLSPHFGVFHEPAEWFWPAD
jgi:lipopolysaccharide transport system ATP-binding protein